MEYDQRKELFSFSDGLCRLNARTYNWCFRVDSGHSPGTWKSDKRRHCPIYGDSTREGYYGANFSLIGGGGTADTTFTYLGAEAGYRNQLTFGGLSIFETKDGGSVWNFNGLGLSQTFSNVAQGMLDVAFIANG